MYIRVHAVPESRKESITEIGENVFQIMVKEPARRNLANKRIQKILAQMCKVEVEQVTMLTGHRSSTKMYSVDT